MSINGRAESSVDKSVLTVSIVNCPTFFKLFNFFTWVHLCFLSTSFKICSWCIHCASSSAGLQHGEQTGPEGRAHRPEWNSTRRRRSGSRGAGSSQQVGNDDTEVKPWSERRLLTVTRSCLGAFRLRRSSVAVKFVTNTTKESKRNLLERLQRLNFNVQVRQPNSNMREASPEASTHEVRFVCLCSDLWRAAIFVWNWTEQEKEIFTSLSAARSLLEQKQHRPLLLVEDSALEDFNGTYTMREREQASVV